jgi:hypothetical protein
MFYHFDVVEILIEEEDFHMEIQDKIYCSVYGDHCTKIIIRGQIFSRRYAKSLYLVTGAHG